MRETIGSGLDCLSKVWDLK